MSVHPAPAFGRPANFVRCAKSIEQHEVVPISHRLVCEGDVKEFLDGASNTVFEMEGRV